MKMTQYTLLVLMLICSLNSESQIKNECYREGNLIALMENVETDETLQLERLTAFHFHQLINQHRIANRQKTLYWDDRLWLASRNHCVYMNTNGQLSHAESRKKELFTGGQPDKRTNFTTYGMRDLFGSGENILYTDVETDKLEELARTVADEAFDIWKNSLGHNQNMLSSQYFAHGTAFIFGSRVWATTVFADPPSSFTKNEIDIDWNETLSNKYPNTFEENGASFKEKKWSRADDELKMFGVLVGIVTEQNVEKSSKLYLAASKHLAYQLEEGGRGLLEKKTSPAYYKSTSKKRYLKATHQFGVFKLISNRVEEIAFSYAVPHDQLENKTALLVLENKLRNEYALPAKLKEWGGTVKLVEVNGTYTCVVDIVFLVKKK